MMATGSFTKTCWAAEGADGTAPALIVFADDWGRHPSSSQHLIRHLLDEHQVYWVNTIGTRRPSLNAATLRRGMEKVRQWARASRGATEGGRNPQVVNPRMWPWFGSALDRRLNRTLLVRQLTPIVRSLPVPAVAITTIPLVADLIGLLPVARWVYYCVDDFGQWPGLDQATIERMERELVRRADTLIAVSETLQEKLRRMGRESVLLTHGIDLEHWTDAACAPGDGSGVLTRLDALERPLVVFWGVIDRRMDVEFVRQLGGELAAGTIVLVGPESDPEPALHSVPQLVRVPAVRYEELPLLAREAAVLIMPYADTAVTRAIQPLKLKEYLATGKPTVVRDLPAVRCWADCLDVADTPGAFAAAVRQRLADGLPDEQRRARARLAEESWAEKSRRFQRYVLGVDATT
jgi:glycosyltransferase involved in cell wall biosynthesis